MKVGRDKEDTGSCLGAKKTSARLISSQRILRLTGASATKTPLSGCFDTGFQFGAFTFTRILLRKKKRGGGRETSGSDAGYGRGGGGGGGGGWGRGERHSCYGGKKLSAIVSCGLSHHRRHRPSSSSKCHKNPEEELVKTSDCNKDHRLQQPPPPTHPPAHPSRPPFVISTTHLMFPHTSTSSAHTSTHQPRRHPSTLPTDTH